MTKLEVDGQLYYLPEPGDGQIQKEIVGIIRQSQPDPLQEIAKVIHDLPADLQQFALREAMALKFQPKPELNQEALEAFVKTPDGLEAFLSLLWRRFQPDLSTEKIYELHAKAIKAHGEGYFACSTPE